MTRERQIAVAIHDVEPATFERCALIRDWLDDHGVDRATLLVIPAPDLHPFFQRRPDLAAWLLDCRDRGDAIAQHGFRHRGLAKRWRPRPRQVRRPDAEFAGHGPAQTQASSTPGGGCSRSPASSRAGSSRPRYAYTPALRRELAAGFDWWATLLRFVGRDRAALAPAVAVRRSPLAVRAAALASGRVLRLDLHPADFDRRRHVLALESVLRGARRRSAVTYDDLC